MTKNASTAVEMETSNNERDFSYAAIRHVSNETFNKEICYSDKMDKLYLGEYCIIFTFIKQYNIRISDRNVIIFYFTTLLLLYCTVELDKLHIVAVFVVKIN